MVFCRWTILAFPCVWIDYQAYQQSGQMAHNTQRHKQCAFNSLHGCDVPRHALAPICRAFGENKHAEAVDNFGRSLKPRR